MNEIQLLNALYIDTVRTLPVDFLVQEFGLSIEIIRVLKKIPVSDLDKLTNSSISLLTTNEAVLCHLLKKC